MVPHNDSFCLVLSLITPRSTYRQTFKWLFNIITFLEIVIKIWICELSVYYSIHLQIAYNNVQWFYVDIGKNLDTKWSHKQHYKIVSILRNCHHMVPSEIYLKKEEQGHFKTMFLIFKSLRSLRKLLWLRVLKEVKKNQQNNSAFADPQTKIIHQADKAISVPYPTLNSSLEEDNNLPLVCLQLRSDLTLNHPT